MNDWTPQGTESERPEPLPAIHRLHPESIKELQAKVIQVELAASFIIRGKHMSFDLTGDRQQMLQSTVAEFVRTGASFSEVVCQPTTPPTDEKGSMPVTSPRIWLPSPPQPIFHPRQNLRSSPTEETVITTRALFYWGIACPSYLERTVTWRLWASDETAPLKSSCNQIMKAHVVVANVGARWKDGIWPSAKITTR